jgi:hypothetical protein
MIKKGIIVFLILGLTGHLFLSGQEQHVKLIVKPVEIHDVLNNPGIGFTTFQRFNGDDLNEGTGWTEGYPIVYQVFNGDLANKDYPQTSIAYFRVYWRYVEPEPGQYNWPMIDKALRTAAERGQTLMIRIPPYGDAVDVPDWYRKMVGKEIPQKIEKWRIDPEDPRYVQYFGGMIRALGQRYDGHPDLESLDISLVGFWGEGEGSHLLTDQTRVALINCYLDNFKKTTLTFQPLNGDAPDPGVLVNGTSIAASWPDGRCNGTGPKIRYLGYRLDCLGDMTTDLWPKQGWSHMTDIYPKDIVKSGMSDAWKKAPVTMEICYTFLHWLEKLKYDEKTVNYIFGEALKWHISSFNAKSCGVPKVWSPLVDTWLNKMGYRFVLRKFEYPSIVAPQGQLSFTSLWENIGVAPIYRDYKFVIRLRNSQKTVILPTNADILTWMPGDIVHDETLFVPYDIPPGKYQLEIAIVSPVSFEPRIKLAISGVEEDGWYPMGNIQVQDK